MIGKAPGGITEFNSCFRKARRLSFARAFACCCLGSRPSHPQLARASRRMFQAEIASCFFCLLVAVERHHARLYVPDLPHWFFLINLAVPLCCLCAAMIASGQQKKARMRMSLSAGAGKGELGGHMATDAFFGDIVFSLSPAEPKTCFF